MDRAAEAGHLLHMMKWLHEVCASGTSVVAMDNVEMGICRSCSMAVQTSIPPVLECSDEFSSKGRLSRNRATASCELKRGMHLPAMEYPTENGHLDVMRWLHSHRNEGCTRDAMDNVVENGHFYIAKWLHEHCNEGCFTRTMDDAAWRGRLDVAKWLHKYCSKGYTLKPWMMKPLANLTLGCLKVAPPESNGRVYDIHQEQCGIPSCHKMVNCAAEAGRFDTVIYLHRILHQWCANNIADEILQHHNFELSLWLRETIDATINNVFAVLPCSGDSSPTSRSRGWRLREDDEYNALFLLSFDTTTLSRKKLSRQ